MVESMNRDTSATLVLTKWWQIDQSNQTWAETMIWVIKITRTDTI